jgi:metal-dependent amidase/aminoacylase/carboxypeptidase family protein
MSGLKISQSPARTVSESVPHSRRGGGAANTESATAAVLSGLDQTRVWQEDLYRHLHENPELSFQEKQTASTVGEKLKAFGFDVHEGIGGTGVVGILRNGDGPTVLMRSEIDALPV